MFARPPSKTMYSSWSLLKKRLLDFPVNVLQPIFRTKSAVTKMSSLDLQLSYSLFGIPRSLFSCPYLECQLMREIHCSRAVLLCHVGGSSEQSNNAASGHIDRRSGQFVSLVRGERNNSLGFLDTHHYSPLRLVHNSTAPCFKGNQDRFLARIG